MSRKGVADALTDDHRAGREDERNLQDSLAVSRAIGDMNLKEWIISEPEIRKIHLTTDCESLILASDGLWDKATTDDMEKMIWRHSKECIADAMLPGDLK
ncbi:hypothetical protein BHE74_00001775 [Ensete ventricosum]|nr:hypothetical protein BHE74_00001775 [Ensete ventricosum]RZR97995.1 hypothetical protein BHM03_00027296 [Ensete ventricosum]